MYPVIRYAGVKVQVTPDTAAELVARGVAELVEGELTAPPLSSTPAEPAPPASFVADVPMTKVTAVPMVTPAAKPKPGPNPNRRGTR